jgi:hypothetical protein
MDNQKGASQCGTPTWPVSPEHTICWWKKTCFLVLRSSTQEQHSQKSVDDKKRTSVGTRKSRPFNWKEIAWLTFGILRGAQWPSLIAFMVCRHGREVISEGPVAHKFREWNDRCASENVGTAVISVPIAALCTPQHNRILRNDHPISRRHRAAPSDAILRNDARRRPNTGM